MKSNRAGWGFSFPGVGLILIFVVPPFFFAFQLSLANQRLVFYLVLQRAFIASIASTRVKG